MDSYELSAIVFKLKKKASDPVDREFLKRMEVNLYYDFNITAMDEERIKNLFLKSIKAGV